MRHRVDASIVLIAATLAASSSAHAQSVPPHLVHFVTAAYPAEAAHERIEATVLLALDVAPDGSVAEATVAQGAGHGFDEAAVAAARQFVFAPATIDGRPVAAHLRYRYRFTLAAAEPAAATRAPSQGVLEGSVRDEHDHPLGGATVTVRSVTGEDAQHATTDMRGGFRVEFPVAPGRAFVTVTAPGFRPFHADEVVAARDDVHVVYRVPHAAERIASGTTTVPGPRRASGTLGDADDAEQEATVRSQRPPREVSRTTLEQREIDHIPGAGGDALRSIQNLPSVARASSLSGDLVVRGSAPGDSDIFVDGTDLPLIYHFGGATSVIPTEMLDRIDFYPGNFSARYGRAMGGVIDVGLRSPRRDRWHLVARVSAIDVGLVADGPLGPFFSVALAVRRSVVEYALGLVEPFFPNFGVTAAPRYYDYQGVLEWRPNARHRVRLSVLGDDDALAILFRQPDDSLPSFTGRFSLATRFHLAQLRWDHDAGGGVHQSAMLSGGWQETDFSAGTQFNYTEWYVPFEFRYEISHPIIPGLIRLNTGIDAQLYPAHEQFLIPRLDDPDQTIAPRIAADFTSMVFMPAVYTEAEITPVPGLRIVPGVRVDWFNFIGQGTVSPRTSFRWEFIHDWVMKGGVGLFTQPPFFDQATNAPNTLIPGQTIGNPHLDPQRAVHYALGFEHNFSRWISLSVEGFYKTLDHLVVAADPFSLFQSPAPPPYSSVGLGRVYGVDVLLRHRASSHFFGWIAYTLMRAERADGPGQPWHPFDYDQTNILSVVGTYTIGWGWETGLRFRYVTGSPITPITGAFYNADTMQYFPIMGPTNSQRAADFHQLDLRVDKTWRFNWGRVGAFLEVINVYNHVNEEGAQYNYNYSQRVPINGLPVFPNIGLRGEF